MNDDERGRFAFDGAEGIAFWVYEDASQEESQARIMFDDLEDLKALLTHNLPGLFDSGHAAPSRDDDELYRAVYYAAEGVIVDEHGVGVLGLSDEVAEAVMTVVAGFRRSARVPVSRDELAENLRRIHFDGTGCGTTASTACSNCFGPSPMTAREIAEHLSTTHDIYPKADRKPADSREAGR